MSLSHPLTAYLTLPLLTLALSALAQEARTLPLTEEAWSTRGLAAEFTTYRGVPALHLGPVEPGTTDGVVTLRDFAFADGTLEYDFAPDEESFFAALAFRRQDGDNTEHVYLRTSFAGQDQVNEAFQYAAVVDGVNYWDLSPDFQAAVAIDSAGWNHVKLVVRGRQLLAYVNDMDEPVLYVPRMDGDTTAGAIGFAGPGYYANLSYSPATEGLAGEEGYDPTLGDGRYLRDWQVSAPRPVEPTRALSTLELPADTVAFHPIAAERRGLVNLSRPYGNSLSEGKTPDDERRVAWLRQTITSDAARTVSVDLGFSDDVAVWVNGRLVYADENNYGSPQMKYPRGRASIDNASFRLPLEAGDNELTVALANDFFGWGLLARIRETEGLAYGEPAGE